MHNSQLRQSPLLGNWHSQLVNGWVIHYLSIKSENTSEIAVNQTVRGRVRILYTERDKLLAKCCYLQIYSKYVFTLFIYLSNVNI